MTHVEGIIHASKHNVEHTDITHVIPRPEGCLFESSLFSRPAFPISCSSLPYLPEPSTNQTPAAQLVQLEEQAGCATWVLNQTVCLPSGWDNGLESRGYPL